MTLASGWAVGRTRARRPRSGLSLIELMVALLVGLMTVMAVVQLMHTYGRQQRLGGSVNDAQDNALIALNAIAQELHSAGNALSNQRLQNCSVLLSDVDGAVLPNFSTAAVSIVDGGAGADTLRVHSAESVRGDVPFTLASDMATAIDDLSVDSTYGARVGDLVLVADNAGQCTLRKITALDSASTPAVLMADPESSPNYNPAAIPAGWISYTTAAATQVFVLGNLTQRTYTVDAAARVLRQRDLPDTTDTPVAEGIVDLQAQYGITATAADDTVTQWVDAAAAPWDAPAPAQRKRIKAVRIAVVVRTGEADNANVSNTPLVLWPAVATGAGIDSTARTFIPSGNERRHRYRVLRMVVPLKNMLWANLS